MGRKYVFKRFYGSLNSDRKVMWALRKRKTISGSDKFNQSGEASGCGINNEALSDFLEEKCQ